jgi:hypothetical protein
MAAKQRFCSTNHRVYASREGLYADTADKRPNIAADSDTSIAAALSAAQAFTPVHLADTKTVASIRVERGSADPVTWKVTVPSGSTVAAGKIYQALASHIGDLVTLANKLGQAADEPQLVINTRTRRKR